jgi:hypothetical protein
MISLGMVFFPSIGSFDGVHLCENNKPRPESQFVRSTHCSCLKHTATIIDVPSSCQGSENHPILEFLSSYGDLGKELHVVVVYPVAEGKSVYSSTWYGFVGQANAIDDDSHDESSGRERPKVNKIEVDRIRPNRKTTQRFMPFLSKKQPYVGMKLRWEML